MAHQTTHDLIVLGGGLAGLSLARQLSLARPGLRLAVVDPRPLPIDPATRRLGESFTEVSSGYFEHRLGLGAHLAAEHQRKLGLRFFLPGPALAERAELGILAAAAPPSMVQDTIPSTWQVHRGRLEHHLAQTLEGELLQGTAELIPGPPHQLRVGDRSLRAPVVVDATAGANVLPLSEEREAFDHGGQAAWFWVEAPLDVGAWSRDPAYQARAHPDLRWRATTHLVGRRGWCWLIRLADQSTSVGIVRPPGQPFEDEAAMLAWLVTEEPELAEAMVGVPRSPISQRAWTAGGHATILDARGLARAGDAAGFLDPLYSSGADLLAITNEVLVPRLLAAIDGTLTAREARRANGLLGLVRLQYMSLYRDLFTVLQSPRATMARLAWDLSTYFGFLALLARNGAFRDDLSPRAAWTGRQVAALQARVSAALVAWARHDPGAAHGCFDQAECGLLNHLLRGLGTPCSGRELDTRLAANLALLEELAVAIFRQAAGALGLPVPDGASNPYAAGLDPARWAADGLRSGRRRREVQPETARDLARLWI